MKIHEIAYDCDGMLVTLYRAELTSEEEELLEAAQVFTAELDETAPDPLVEAVRDALHRRRAARVAYSRACLDHSLPYEEQTGHIADRRAEVGEAQQLLNDALEALEAAL